MAQHKVIFDTDPGVDDAMALLFLDQHPDIDLVGITSVFGNASIDTTTRNALFLKQLWAIDAPVARGAGRAVHPDRVEGPPPTFVHGDNGLGNVAGVPDSVDIAPDPRPAAQFIIDLVRANPGEISIVAVGRMTNLALALALAPDIVGLVKQVVIMGGAFDVPGNLSPAAEANIIGDPEAADSVMTADWKVVAIGLDVTHKTVMTRAEMAEVARIGGPKAQFLSDVSQFYIDFYQHIIADGMFVHDSCAAVYVVAPELFTLRRGAIRVSCEGIAVGQTIQKPDGMFFPPGPWDGMPSQSVCVEIDAPAVMSLIKKTLSGQ
ncbi:nucleoside hydrolase [Devosia rhodophyticola]|uniref:Nucleoside hydrolase n=1 Tax=Devosia rhodophyticola TaxID=3026423 RepID=A0ABY7YY84_9HYPH|nr:nucleoside hydrolase [Devosia rhodophyticola]WDR06321.1 nucleoside hydrolase [Devosia rhodophyticola]